MEELEQLKQENVSLKRQLSFYKRDLKVLILIFMSIAMTLDFIVLSKVERFRSLFNEMMKGEPLPQLTEFVIVNQWSLFVGSFLVAVLVVLLIFYTERKKMLFGTVFLVLLTFVKAGVVFVSMFLPLFNMISNLG